jgi:hypothetical protein
VRIIEPILEAMGIPHHLINDDADVAKIAPAIEDAYAASHPLALLIGRRPSAALPSAVVDSPSVHSAPAFAGVNSSGNPGAADRSPGSPLSRGRTESEMS